MSTGTHQCFVDPAEWLAAMLILHPQNHKNFIGQVEWTVERFDLQGAHEGAALGVVAFAVDNGVGFPEQTGKTLGRITRMIREEKRLKGKFDSRWPRELVVALPRACVNLMTSFTTSSDEAAIALLLAAEHGIRELRAESLAATLCTEGFRSGLGGER